MMTFTGVVAFIITLVVVPQVYDGMDLVIAFPIVFGFVWYFITGNFVKHMW